MKRSVWAAIVFILILGAVLWRSGIFSTLVPESSKPSPLQSTDRQDKKGAAQQRFPGKAIFVTTADVKLTPPRSRIQSVGTGKAIRSIHVIADVAGTVENLHVLPNTDVTVGEPIVTLERKTQDILLKSAKAELEKQSAAYNRYETLLSQNSNAISQAQVDESRASLAAAEASVAEAQYEYDRRIIRAPFSGRINLNDLTVGSYLPQGAEIVTLVDGSTLLVEFTVPETAVARIQTGVPVRLLTPALRGRVFNGEITAFDSAIDEEFRTVRVRAEVKNPQFTLVPGMTFSVTIASIDTPMPMVPAISVLWNQDGAYVWRLGADDKPEEALVTLRHREGDNVWVEADLKTGDRVIQDGAFKVGPGSVLAIDEDTASMEQIRG